MSTETTTEMMPTYSPEDVPQPVLAAAMASQFRPGENSVDPGEYLRRQIAAAVTEWHRAYAPLAYEGQEVPSIARDDVIRIVPGTGAPRIMVVSHVEHHVITLADVEASAAGRDGCRPQA